MSWAKRTEPVISIPLERTLVGVAIGLEFIKAAGMMQPQRRREPKNRWAHRRKREYDAYATLIYLKF
jgi:hypothetical protein